MNILKADGNTMRDVIRKSVLLCLLIVLFLPGTSSWASQGGHLPANISVSFNGKFVYHPSHENSQANSENGLYWCQYDIGHVGDEVRQLLDFKLFEDERLLFTLPEAPGSDLYISNRGFIAFIDMGKHYKGELTVNFYSRHGQQLFSETFQGAFLFGFSPGGERFGVGTSRDLCIFSLPDRRVETYEKGFHFDISGDESLLAVAGKDRVKVYSQGELRREIATDLCYARQVKVSSEGNLVAVIDKKRLLVYSLLDGSVAFADTLGEKLSYRDLVFEGEKILTGIHHRDGELSRGILRVYHQGGEVVTETEESVKTIRSHRREQPRGQSPLKYEQIPWPFEPFDETHTVWNYYEQHMGGFGAGWSYLHQGLDIITPIGEPTYAVAEGIVKCVLTLGGPSSWRIAIGKEQTADRSKGWLYAHLIESSIQFDVGDTVQVHDYLGDIIKWTESWGHVHFVEIQDSGLVWRYDDDEWGITYNPLLSLRPDTDLFPPIIADVFEDSKFAFCLNETSVYLDPDSLYGAVDIIARIGDYVAYSAWVQPAFKTYYWVKKMPQGDIAFPRTLGQILNHSYDFYQSVLLEPYATVIYKRDELLVPPDYMNTQRDYYHILTNNNGDSLVELSEKELAFHTMDYPDGDYRLFVEAGDEYGNSTVDSMDVKFRNGLVSIPEQSEGKPVDFAISQNCPNPFNPMTKICYTMPRIDFVTLKAYDILGREVRTLVNEIQGAGAHSIVFHAGDLSSGVYLYRLQIGSFAETRKMVLLK